MGEIKNPINCKDVFAAQSKTKKDKSAQSGPRKRKLTRGEFSKEIEDEKVKLFYNKLIKYAEELYFIIRYSVVQKLRRFGRLI